MTSTPSFRRNVYTLQRSIDELRERLRSTTFPHAENPTFWALLERAAAEAKAVRDKAAPTREELLVELRALANNGDYEIAHGDADNLLIAYINDEEIAEAYGAVGKWYA